MLFNRLALVAAVVTFAACGGGSDSAPAAESTPAPAMEAAAPVATGAVTLAPATGTTYEVRMIGDDKGFRFEPANLTIKSGDAVKFIAISGFPHNVAFSATGMAAEVKAQLDANFGTYRMAELTSNMYMVANESATISFANIPAGKYEFNCTPHLAMGMKGVITVE